MNSGKDFETQFRASVPDGVYYFRIKDPAQSFFKGEELRFSPNNPYDAILYKYPYMYTLELKSIKGTSITYYKDGEKNAGIKKHQIEGLSESASHAGVISGFILNFRKTAHTYFLNILDFNKNISLLGKKSINENDVLNFGGILIKQRLKRTKYFYDIEAFLNAGGN